MRAGKRFDVAIDGPGIRHAGRIRVIVEDGRSTPEVLRLIREWAEDVSKCDSLKATDRPTRDGN